MPVVLPHPSLPLAPLAGRVAIVTGVSRQVGIAATITRQMLIDGASVVATGWHQHDADQPWGAEGGRSQATVDFVTAEIANAEGRLHYVERDLADPDVPDSLANLAVGRFGALDIIVACHARSSGQSLRDVTVAELDASWAVNARATVLLAKALQRCRDPRRLGGRLITFTSGQHLGPMPNEVPYIISKGAIQQMTASLSDALIDEGITVNCINPGPVDTGYANAEGLAQVAARFPAKRWGQPSDVASLVRFLVSDDGAWVTGQTINSEGGFRR